MWHLLMRVCMINTPVYHTISVCYTLLVIMYCVGSTDYNSRMCHAQEVLVDS